MVTDDYQDVKFLFANEKICGNDNMFENEIICPIDVESDKMKTFQIQKISLTLLTFDKIQTKLLPFKTRIVPIITKNIQKLQILLNIRF